METVSLKGRWKCKADFENNGIKNMWYNLEKYNLRDTHLLEIEIPKSFNLLKGFENYEGIFWYFNQFEMDIEKDLTKYDYQIRFKGSNYNTKVWFNGEFLGEHNGGFTPFIFDINNLIKNGSNFLAVRTNNTRKYNQIPSISFDWFNWGGIYRNVELLILHKNRVQDVFIKIKSITKQESKIEISFKIIGEISLNWQISDFSKRKILYEGTSPEYNGRGMIRLTVDNPKLWSPNTPNLYNLKMFNRTQKNKDLLIFETAFGIRQIEVKGIHIYLNKKKIFLKGASLHEEYMPYGRTIPYEKRREDVENFKLLGFNAIRTAHYSHDEALVKIADKIGLLVLEEIPVYQHCDFKSSQTYETAKNMLKELIIRDRNHPSVIWWSVGNEVPLHQRTCASFIKSLIDFARELDDTRLITCVSRKLIPDLTRNYVDVATINTYFGWYFGHEKMISLIMDIIRTPVFNKPWIYTEFGAGARYGFHADWNKQRKYSEEKQLQVLDYTIRTINSKEFFAGWFIWNYRDFKSLKRNNQFQKGFNRKGIVSGEKNEKKLIYYRIPQILNKKRKIQDTKIIGILLWIVMFPFSFLIFTRLIDYFLKYLEFKPDYLNR